MVKAKGVGVEGFQGWVEHKFCIYCGKPLTSKPTGFFDPATGKAEEYRLCLNRECEKGKQNFCIQSGGHAWNFWGTKCKKCGIRKGRHL